MNETTKRTQAHATFAVERTYPVPVAAVWHALSDNAARDQWFTAGDAFTAEEKHHDFRVGGQSTETGQWHGGPRSRFQSTYTDIVEPERIVFTYDMWVDERHLSTSVTTITLEDGGDRTLLTYVEQGVHFDGLDSPEGREEGTKGLLGQLGAYLASSR
jgi:uncharacterized protein YndB with AHSA1/START domain